MRLDALPDWVLPIVAEIAVIVEEEQPTAEARPGVMLLGQYRGFSAPATADAPPARCRTRSLLPDPDLLTSSGPEDVPGRVLKVLGHEVGHALGLSEARLRELGWY